MQPLEFIKDCSLSELIEVKSLINEEISHRQDTAKHELLNEIREKAQVLGLSHEDLSKAIKKMGTSKASAPPKYRNQLNPKETWSGRGRKPKWLSLQLGEGRELDEFLIPESVT